MKAPPFEWIRAEHLEHVFELMQEFGDEARILAGGQTLLATLNMRLSEPSVLIDINELKELRHITSAGEMPLCVGALTTHSDIEDSRLVELRTPLLHRAAPYIAHRAIRNRGTWGGSIAYADPAAEWPACALALDATIIVQSRLGTRRVAAEDFFVGLYATALEDGEIVVGTEFPAWAASHVCSFQELSRRHGDYAIVGLAATGIQAQNSLNRIRLAFFGIGAVPFRAKQTEAYLEGHEITPQLLASAVDVLRGELTGNLEPIADATNSIALKRQLASVMLRRNMEALCVSQAEPA